MMNKGSRSERNWVFIWAAAIALLSSLPYLWGLYLAPKGYHFLGLTHNIDDGAVYLSWMRQAADGHFFIRNLFTSEPQVARAFNVLFLVMGNFARVTHLPLILVFHLFRIGFGILLIWSIWRFSKLFLADSNQRRLLIPLVGLSAGIGWLIPGAQAPTGSVDVWQPEAITFLSIYLNPLFLAGLVLMIWSFYFLLRMQRTGRVGDTVIAGTMLLLLGNIHTYDVITVGCVWAVYVVVICITEHKIKMKTITLSLLTAIIALPSVAYQYYIYKIDPVYAARVNSPTPSPEIWSFFTGYGLVLIGALTAVIILARVGQFKIQNFPRGVGSIRFYIAVYPSRPAAKVGYGTSHTTMHTVFDCTMLLDGAYPTVIQTKCIISPDSRDGHKQHQFRGSGYETSDSGPDRHPLCSIHKRF